MTIEALRATQPSHGHVAAMVEDVIGCKWSLTILKLVRDGVRRPGAIERTVPGLSTKVLNERLKKLVAYRILDRIAYAEVPPRVEYAFTSFGERFMSVLDAITDLEREARELPR